MWVEQILIPLCQWLVVSTGDQVVQNSTCTPESSKLPAAPGLCLCFSLGCSTQERQSQPQGCCKGVTQEPCPAVE